MKKLWILRRIRNLGGSMEDLLTVYKLQLRCLTEMCCPAWNGSLTQENIRVLERLQKTTLWIILGHEYTDYTSALKKFDLDTLENRRSKLSLSFARKTASNSKYEAWFPKTSVSTRAGKPYTKPYARTSIYQKSPLFYLMDLLNSQD